jgi:pimeloyl-ACP methyl ester carboxylesterase
MSNKYEVVTITTPQRNLLFGLWYSATKPKRTLIYLHGLGSSAFSHEKLFSLLADSSTSILKLQNRGHDIVSKLNKIDKRKSKGYATSKIAGSAHEVFSECVDDIQGAVNFLNEHRIKNIFLLGHSTGCQKSIYYLSKRGKQKQVKGVILLCPVSDHASAVLLDENGKLGKAQKSAAELVSQNKSDILMPQDVWEEEVDAQRFLSLYTPDSEEEIFSYINPDKKPTTLQKVKIPMLTVYAQKDEYLWGTSAKKVVTWFSKYSKSSILTVEIIKGAPHGLQDYEVEVAQKIKEWLSG